MRTATSPSSSPCSRGVLDKDIASGESVDLSCSVDMRLDLIKPSDVRLTSFDGSLSLKNVPSNGRASSNLMFPYILEAKPRVIKGLRFSLSLFVNQASSSVYDQHSPSEEICSFPDKLVLCELLHMFILSSMNFILVCLNTIYKYS